MTAEDEQRRLWNRAAGAYDRAMQPLERRWLGPERTRLLARARGRTLEAGIGTGVNLPLYPDTVELTGVDSSPAMLAVAGRRASELGRAADLRLGVADSLDEADAALDTVVATLLLCSVPDVARTLGEFARVLRPGGRLLLLDHVESSWAPVRGAQRLADAMTAHTGECWRRRPLLTLAASGFVVEDVRASRGRLVEAVVARRA
ncbi:class I SAM-dependent methyltransferase [Propioniciclava tarda]|uniref:Class I SAM-dependent methyltransferase n=1 Tax=Propioniciclava tarda TaxID=433330 RepID=A0A4Q9KK28_PROTD|nr:class I SAM-dependent methyltransferase [Propioniciclava tarda]TBT94768.1 class I SAM-dependent methyltransferase [Propioniciclava tarda]SMO64339.1 Ubiquinone/menaquinone biosynthesis C-methylase UbiE [Propioniciclava tarda]